MSLTVRQLTLLLAITILSNLAVMPLKSFVRDLRSYGDREVPTVAFVLAPDHGQAAIFFRNGSSFVGARVKGSQAYKDLMSRQNTTFTTTDNASNLQTPVCQLWGLCKILLKQPKTMEDIDRAAVEPSLRSLKAAVEGGLSYPINFVIVALSGQNNSHDYLTHIVSGAVRQIGLTETWTGKFPTLQHALLSTVKTRRRERKSEERSF